MDPIPHRHPEASLSLIHRLRSLPKHVLSFCWDAVLTLPSRYIVCSIRLTGLEAACEALCSILGIRSFAWSDRRAPSNYPSRELDSDQGHYDPDPRLSVVHGVRHPPILKSICDFLDVHAAVSPTSLAVQDILGGQLTYGALRTRSVHLAQRLQGLGVRRGSRVCLVVERSSAFLVALFAVLRLGAAYIPLDGCNIPTAVLKDIVDDARPAVILVSKAHISRHGSVEGSWYCIEDLLCEEEDNGGVDFQFGDTYARPEDPAYIIFTSGSIPRFIDLNFSLTFPCPKLLSVAFDMCAWEVFSCILNGGSLYLRGPRRQDWIKVMKAVDVLICTPSIEPHDAKDYPNLKVVATAGEPCTKALLERWSNKVDFYNSCGPTEVTIVNTMDLHRCAADVTIGYPTPNNSVYVLDSELRPVPRGEVGVMWAGGAGISLGYLNLPELTKTRYKPDPFRADGGMMYNTGDLGRLRVDGKLEHRGRVDDQVKVKEDAMVLTQGFRVELDGVSAAMHSCPGITSACALLIDGELHGFYAPDSVPVAAVVEETTALQPRYAVPTRYLALNVLPLTANGKVDKRKLREIGADPNTQFEMP
uniref:Filamentous fungal-specific transmembrane protein n=1 Tax=Ganoderma boninense TaxID=34458 RepID=A0A5K1JW48_9APHY|nr:Filamentous fungal-specific transmembrane protein [Ganoderma boninense]